MTRYLIVLIAALALAPAALADGMMPYAAQGGEGVLSPTGNSRYVAIGSPDGQTTMLTRIATSNGAVIQNTSLLGAWGIPVPVAMAGTNVGGGLSVDGETLVLEQVGWAYPRKVSKFLVLSLPSMRVRTGIVLEGDFQYDALSPSGRRLYLIQHVDGMDTTRYVVRAYDTYTNRLLPGRIADRTQESWVMQGFPTSRATSSDGRWVYTMYANPGGFPFVHALDTVRGVAHCVGMPWHGGDNAQFNMRVSLHGSALHVHWASGRRWLALNTQTWRLSSDHAGGFPWWTLAFLALLPPAGLLFLRRRRGADVDAELAELLATEERPLASDVRA